MPCITSVELLLNESVHVFTSYLEAKTLLILFTYLRFCSLVCQKFASGSTSTRKGHTIHKPPNNTTISSLLASMHKIHVGRLILAIDNRHMIFCGKISTLSPWTTVVLFGTPRGLI